MMKRVASCLLLLLIFFSAHLLVAAEKPAPALKATAIQQAQQVPHQTEAEEDVGLKIGEKLPLWSCIPFAGILLSIALFPLFAPEFWHHHFGKVSLFWALVTVIPFVAVYGHGGLHEILHVYIGDYIPFIILLWALFVVASNIYLKGTLVGTPLVNTGMLGVGTCLASWMGTTGAAMLLIRPFLRANKHRKYRTFMVCFFIFLVANIGGSLTPLGDPPLFIGFLHGVPFFWTTLRLLPILGFTAGIILVIYFLVDLYFYKKEGIKEYTGEKEPLSLQGWYNIFFLLGIIGAILFSGMVHLGTIRILGVEREIESVIRDVALIVLGLISFMVTPAWIREENEFSWFPIKEVAYLFFGIFATMVPCLLILKAGDKGSAAFLVKAVKEPAHYFWATGALSSFLDNTPTYYTFFTSALGKFYVGLPEHLAVKHLLVQHPTYLEAISAGAVFFGANTYIGNAPNFMVRSIAEESGTPMPSFFGYILKYSLIILIPVFILDTIVFFH